MIGEYELDLSAMRHALAQLGTHVPVGSEVVIAGGAAAVLCHWLQRVTTDIDVIVADPRLVALQQAVEIVAEELGLSPHWLNDGAKGYAQVLPSDYHERLVTIGQFGGLSVRSVARQDFILLKVYGMRDVDVEDLEQLQPTAEELTFVRAQLPRIAEFDARKAYYMELYLEQGSDTPLP